MSSKVIDFADFSYMCRLGLYKPCSKNCNEEICEEWKLLKAPTLADVCGKRELKDMTEEEFEELLKVAGLDSKRVEKNNQNAASIFQKYNGKYDNNKVYVNYDCNILEIEPGTVWMQGNYFKPVEVMRWFVDQKFNMYWEDNEDEEETEGGISC